MITKIILPVLCCLACCLDESAHPEKAVETLNQGVAKNKFAWTKLLDTAGWKKSYNFQMFSMKDKLWVFHPDGVWYSSNGVNWNKSELTNSINNLAFLDYVQFKDAVYGLGHFEGNIESFSLKTEIYKTSDLKHWNTIATQSNLPKRFFYHPFVFKNKIWIVGGEDKHIQHADIWNSSDGINWNQVKGNLPFGKRSHSKIVNLRDTLYLLNNDVWISVDGIEWKRIATEIVKDQTVFGYAVEVLDDKIWLIGCNRNGLFTSQVLTSSNGVNWAAQDAPWTPRGGMASVVHHNKIYVTGGKYGGTPDQPDFRYSNDVWVLEKTQ